MNRLYAQYKDDVAFYAVYIREAHSSDGWQIPTNVKDDVVLASPKTNDERSEIGRMCVVKLGIEFPAVVDGMDNSTEQAYTGWPDRLYVIDRDGRVAFKSPPGPFGFHSEGVAATLKKLVPNPGAR